MKYFYVDNNILKPRLDLFIGFSFDIDGVKTELRLFDRFYKDDVLYYALVKNNYKRKAKDPIYFSRAEENGTDYIANNLLDTDNVDELFSYHQETHTEDETYAELKELKTYYSRTGLISEDIFNKGIKKAKAMKKFGIFTIIIVIGLLLLLIAFLTKVTVTRAKNKQDDIIKTGDLIVGTILKNTAMYTNGVYTHNVLLISAYNGEKSRNYTIICHQDEASKVCENNPIILAVRKGYVVPVILTKI